MFSLFLTTNFATMDAVDALTSMLKNKFDLPLLMLNPNAFTIAL